jgi:uncharacterized protein (DUF3084 family)
MMDNKFMTIDQIDENLAEVKMQLDSAKLNIARLRLQLTNLETEIIGLSIQKESLIEKRRTIVNSTIDKTMSDRRREIFEFTERRKKENF